MGSKSPRYTIELKRAASRALRRLPQNLLDRLRRKLDALAIDPRPADCIRMQSDEELYRVKVGDWRIIYAIIEDRLVVLVVDIGPRGGIYKDY